MKQEMIDRMRAELYDNYGCLSDFEKYDVPQLEKGGGAFVWCVYSGGTHLVMCDAESIGWTLASEERRIQCFRDYKWPIEYMTYYKDNPSAKYFYWDGSELREVGCDDIVEFWSRVFLPVLEAKKREFPQEFAVCDAPLSIKFASEAGKEAYSEAMKVAYGLCDESLRACFRRLGEMKRLAVDCYIEVSRDFERHSFVFVKMTNGIPGINGGVVADFSRQSNRWSIHT